MGVRTVKTVGAHGCYTIFKGRDFRSTNLCWKHMDKLNIMEAGYGYSVVRYVLVQNIKKPSSSNCSPRSVKYDPDCNCN